MLERNHVKFMTSHLCFKQSRQGRILFCPFRTISNWFQNERNKFLLNFCCIVDHQPWSLNKYVIICKKKKSCNGTLMHTCVLQAKQVSMGEYLFALFFFFHYICGEQNIKFLLHHVAPQISIFVQTFQFLFMHFFFVLFKNIFHNQHSVLFLGTVRQNGLFQWSMRKRIKSRKKAVCDSSSASTHHFCSHALRDFVVVVFRF